MTQEFLDEFAEEHGFISALRTSAKTGENVIQTYSQLVREIFVQEFSTSQITTGKESIYGDSNGMMMNKGSGSMVK